MLQLIAIYHQTKQGYIQSSLNTKQKFGHKESQGSTTLADAGANNLAFFEPHLGRDHCNLLVTFQPIHQCSLDESCLYEFWIFHDPEGVGRTMHWKPWGPNGIQGPTGLDMKPHLAYRFLATGCSHYDYIICRTKLRWFENNIV